MPIVGLPLPGCQGAMCWGSMSYAASGGQGDEAVKKAGCLQTNIKNISFSKVVFRLFFSNPHYGKKDRKECEDQTFYHLQKYQSFFIFQAC